MLPSQVASCTVITTSLLADFSFIFFAFLLLIYLINIDFSHSSLSSFRVFIAFPKKGILSAKAGFDILRPKSITKVAENDNNVICSKEI